MKKDKMWPLYLYARNKPDITRDNSLFWDYSGIETVGN